MLSQPRSENNEPEDSRKIPYAKTMHMHRVFSPISDSLTAFFETWLISSIMKSRKSSLIPDQSAWFYTWANFFFVRFRSGFFRTGAKWARFCTRLSGTNRTCPRLCMPWSNIPLIIKKRKKFEYSPKNQFGYIRPICFRLTPNLRGCGFKRIWNLSNSAKEEEHGKRNSERTLFYRKHHLQCEKFGCLSGPCVENKECTKKKKKADKLREGLALGASRTIIRFFLTYPPSRHLLDSIQLKLLFAFLLICKMSLNLQACKHESLHRRSSLKIYLFAKLF